MPTYTNIDKSKQFNTNIYLEADNKPYNKNEHLEIKLCNFNRNDANYLKSFYISSLMDDKKKLKNSKDNLVELLNHVHRIKGAASVACTLAIELECKNIECFFTEKQTTRKTLKKINDLIMVIDDVISHNTKGL
ncbi:hypothetical protein L2735_05730 [Shewanella olleyana]|uniref:hypothetical protein n=1 Tax=Shewanella olleyana TaxID=135626 RepID=UPI00200D0E30|nr:hypothetical protein [Shewanella olleyana]MCL1066307.1 hypothetical protein [Shewanella olleyana]